MSATILQFFSRGEQLRKRGMDNYSHWKRITKGLQPFGPADAADSINDKPRTNAGTATGR